MKSSNKRSADPEDAVPAVGAHVAAVHDAKRSKVTTEAAAPATQPRSLHTSCAFFRHCSPYRANEEAAILAAYEQCRRAGKTWSAEMDALAAQLGRTKSALMQKCIDLVRRPQLLEQKQH
jgi:hypothetical protein